MAATIVRSNSAAQNTNAATVSPTLGGTATAGNLLVLTVSADDYISVGNRPTGYTFSTGMGQETYCGHYLFWKVAAGGETGTSYTIGSATRSAWIMAEISGLTATPYDISNGTLTQSSGATQATPTITPTAGDRYLIASFGGGNDTTFSVTSATNSFTERADVSTNANTFDNVSYYDSAVTATGSSTYTTTATYSISDVDARTALIIAFKVSSVTNIPMAPAQGAPAFTGRTPNLALAIPLPGVKVTS